jgi:hypothetical protein
MELSKNEQKYFDECLAVKKSNILCCVVAKDGLLYLFDEEDIIPYLNAAFKEKDDVGWFFNQTRDRYVAERGSIGGTIGINPSGMYYMFDEIIY